MNKAFVREPDDNGQRACPRCASLGVAVGPETLAAHVPAENLQHIAESAFYCPFPRCEVAYFDDFDQVVDVTAARGLSYPKDPTAPLCPCFGLTVAEIDRDLSEGTAERTRALIEKARSPAAHCSTAAPDGRSCIAAVQKYFMQNRAHPPEA